MFQCCLPGSAEIGDGHTVPFPGALNFNFTCDGPSASITKDCGGSQCRLFFTEFGIWVPLMPSDASLERTRGR